jgi:hypothetical protein
MEPARVPLFRTRVPLFRRVPMNLARRATIASEVARFNALVDRSLPPKTVVAALPATQYHNIVDATAKEESPLFKLGEELRYWIFRLCLVSHLPIQIKRRPFPGEPALLRTCKQIREEAQMIFWTGNTFQGRDAVHVCNSMNRAPQVLYQRRLSVLLEWLDRIGNEKARLIQKLEVDYDVGCQFNSHEEYISNWPATPKDVMQLKRRNLGDAARFAAIKGLRGLLYHGAPLEAIEPILVLKGTLGAHQIDQFGALWKLAMEEVIGVLKTGQA